MQGTDGSLEGSWLESVGVAVALAAALVGAGADVVFTFDEHGGVHEELGDVGESLAEAFGEKGLEELVLKGMFGMFVHGLGLFCLSSFRLKAMNGLRNPLGGGAAPGESPIPLRSIGLSPGESQVVDLRFYRRTFTLPHTALRPSRRAPCHAGKFPRLVTKSVRNAG